MKKPELSPELVTTNPHLTFLDMGRGFRSSCDLIPPTINNRFASCPIISHEDKVVASKNENGWIIKGIKAPIISCAECPVARENV